MYILFHRNIEVDFMDISGAFNWLLQRPNSNWHPVTGWGQFPQASVTERHSLLFRKAPGSYYVGLGQYGLLNVQGMYYGRHRYIMFSIVFLQKMIKNSFKLYLKIWFFKVSFHFSVQSTQLKIQSCLDYSRVELGQDIEKLFFLLLIATFR